MNAAERSKPFGQPRPTTRRETLLSRCEERDCGHDTPCWVWLWGIDRDGYGQLAFDKRNGEQRAHRWAYELFVGPIPEGLHVHHHCENRACVNPAHLEPVTPRENLMFSSTASAALKASQTHCIYGHPFDAENTYLKPGGFRACRECHRRRKREYNARQRARK